MGLKTSTLLDKQKKYIYIHIALLVRVFMVELLQALLQNNGVTLELIF